MDRKLIRQAFSDSGADVNLHFADNGASALAKLTELDGATRKFTPDVCIFDINMPGISGLELLQKLKQHSELRRLPVLMLSSSDDEQDVSRCYDLQASAYACKPNDYRGLRELIAGIGEFWQSTISFPNRIQAAGYKGGGK